MSRSTVLAGVVSFAVTLVVGLVAASALRAETTEIALPEPESTVTVPIAGGGTLSVEAARLELGDAETNGLDDRPEPPPRGQPAPVPEDAGTGGSAADAALAEAEEELAGLDLQLLGVPLELIPVGGFVDACVENPDDCPLGLVAVVLDPIESAGPPLHVVANYAAADMDDLDHCQNEFSPAAHNFIVYSSNPVAIRASYGITEEGLELEVSDPGPQPGHPVYTRWEGLVESGELADLPPIEQVVWCVALPGVDDLTGRDAIWNIWDITGTDPFGQSDTVEWWLSFEVGRTDWPPATIGLGPELLIRVGVWERTEYGSTHRGLAWPVDHTDPDAESCTEVEERLVVESDPSIVRFFWDHPDMHYNFAPVSVNEEVRPATRYDGEWDLRTFAMPLREGRTYTLCLWELRRGDRSFDTWEVVNRETRDVTTPNLNNVAIHGIVNVRENPDGPVSFGALVEGPTRPCRMYAHGGGTGEITAAGRYSIRGHNRDLPDPTALCHSDGLGYDDMLLVTPIVTAEAGQFYGDPHAIALDTREGCDFTAEGAGCVGARGEVHEFEFVGCPACPAAEFIIYASYLPSLGGGSGQVQVGDFGGFEPADRADSVGAPKLDEDGVEFGPVPGTTDSMFLRFETDRSVEAIAELTPHERDYFRHDCDVPVTRLVSEGGTFHEFTFSGLCAGTVHTPRVVLSDATGESASYSGLHAPQMLPKRTNGFVGEFETTVTLVETDVAALEAHCRQIADAYLWRDDMPDAFDPWCRRFAVWSPRGRAFVAGSSLGNPVQWDYCLSRDLVEYRQQNHPGTEIAHTETIEVTISYRFDQTPDCGLDPFYITGLPFTAFERTLVSSMEDLLQGISTTFTEDGLTWQIEARLIRTRVHDDSGETWDSLGP